MCGMLSSKSWGKDGGGVGVDIGLLTLLVHDAFSVPIKLS